MKRSKQLTIASVAAMAAVTLTACAGASGGDADVAPADSGEVAWWGYTPDTPVAERYIAEFKKEYPDITVTYKNFENVDYRNTIVSALESGQGFCIPANFEGSQRPPSGLIATRRVFLQIIPMEGLSSATAAAAQLGKLAAAAASLELLRVTKLVQDG